MVLNCKMCGATLELKPGQSICMCSYCNSWQTIPMPDDEQKIKLYKKGDELFSAKEFDRASNLYEIIVTNYPTETVAYWNIVLCKYGIEYVTDSVTNERIPTCHRASYYSILNDDDYLKAMSLADAGARDVYQSQALQLEDIRRRIIEVSKYEQPYDCFICYKETDQYGNRTPDSVIAEEVYEKLTEKGYRVFFSKVTLEEKLGVEYEPYIFAALNTAKVMIVIGTSKDNFEAVWVRNEWGRYLKLMNESKDRYLIPCYKNMNPYDMPTELSKLQAQDFNKIGAIQDLVRGVEKIISKKNTSGEGYQRIDLKTLLTNAKSLYDIGNYKDAMSMYKRITQEYPREWTGWWGLILCEYSQRKKDKDIDSIIEWYGYAYKLGDNNAKQFLQQNIVGVLYGNKSNVSVWKQKQIKGSIAYNDIVRECKKTEEQLGKANAKRVDDVQKQAIAKGESEKTEKKYKSIVRNIRKDLVIFSMLGFLTVGMIIYYFILPIYNETLFMVALEKAGESDKYLKMAIEYALKQYILPILMIVFVIIMIFILIRWLKDSKKSREFYTKLLQCQQAEEQINAIVENDDQYISQTTQYLNENKEKIIAVDRLFTADPVYLENYLVKRSLWDIGVNARIDVDPGFESLGNKVLADIKY